MDRTIKSLSMKKVVSGDIGIEIECENIAHNVMDKRWKSIEDGSLRGINREFILRSPLPVAEVPKALAALNKELQGHNINFSFRTSVHVHVNVQPLTHEQVLNFIYLYLLFEEPLMRYCGESRIGNRFCLRLADAEGLMDLLCEMAKSSPKIAYAMIPEDMYRYSAINIEAMKKYNSLEFRGMRGTLDEDILNTWVNTLYSLREEAKKYQNPREILRVVQEMGIKVFFRNTLGDLAKEFIYRGFENDLNRSLSISLDFPYSYNYVEDVEVKPKAPRIADVIPNNPLNLGDLLALHEEPQDRYGAPLHNGDTVVCIGKVADRPNQAGWVDDMNAAAGRIGKIVFLDPMGASVDWGDDLLNQYYFPYASLVKKEAEEEEPF